ncbi:hypothetical protein T02_3674 [Trichinella nativa]|uniref:Uncharacterized protein n=1 Tax=Trichinella nativa TaxID=6335 RepID=A0A0V1KMH9_9BILA|nr:hypothetical protein T02_3674 [Trichinella nativa]
MDYVIRKFFSHSRCHSQIAFPTVLMFFLVTQVHNCEDESRILNDLHRITIKSSRVLVRSIKFDYCSVHVSTVISHVSQQFRFLVFFIVTQWVVSVQWNYFYKLEYLSLMVVQVSLNGLKRCTKIYTSLVVRVAISAFGEYFCRVLCE